MFFLRKHWGFLLVLAMATPLMAAFAWQDTLATFGDDSASYLVLARYFRGFQADPFTGEWAGYHAHFAPLFPLLLAGAGGAFDLRIAHELVAGCAIASLVLVYWYASREFARMSAGLAVTVLFLLTPTAWISMKGILSEPLYLLACMACLLHYEARLARGRRRAVEWLGFGVLLACVYLARAAGVAMILAYGIHAGWRIAASRERRLEFFLPLAPLLVLVGLWYGLRPVADSDAYGRTAGSLMESWVNEPALMLRAGGQFLFSGWISSFTSEENVSLGMKTVFGLLGLLGLLGAILRAAKNRLDGWFVLGSVAITYGWVFAPDNTRRLLYPVVPLLLLCAGDFVRAVCARAGLGGRAQAKVTLAVALFPALLCVPALLLIAAKARDGRIVIPGAPYAYRDITDYYTAIDGATARGRSVLVATTLAGLEAIDRVTPPGAKVMWMRPEYVALLGRRRAEPFYYQWSPATLADEVRKRGVDYIVVSRLFKTDLDGANGDPLVTLRGIERYTQPVFDFGNDALVLVKVDRVVLDRVVGTARTPS